MCSPLLIISCKKVEKRPIGLQLYSLRDDMQKDPKGTIEKLGKIGYTFVIKNHCCPVKSYNTTNSRNNTLIIN